MRLYALGDALWSKNDAGDVRPVSGAMVLLDEEVVGGGGAASVTLTVPTGYRQLIVYWAARCDNGSAQLLGLRMNADTGANYDSQIVTTASTTTTGVTVIAGTSIRVGVVTPTASPASSFNMGEFKVPYYDLTTMHKFVTGNMARADQHSSGNVYTETIAGKWRNTAAITSLTLLPAAGNFIEHSRFTLYGLI
jgi:hypothetical protein